MAYLLDDPTDPAAVEQERAASAAASSGLLNASLGSLGAGSLTATTATKAKRKTTKGKEKNVEDNASSAGAIAAVHGQEASEFLLQLQRTDPEMATVCARHESIRGTTATCLGKLSVASFLAGQKLGQALTGVGCAETMRFFALKAESVKVCYVAICHASHIILIKQ